MDGQVTWLDLGISCGKTWSEPLAATEEKTSRPCWKKLRVSQNQDFLYLDCRTSRNGQSQEPLTVMGGLSLGGLTTLRTGEKPSETAVQEMLSVWGPHSVAEESRLSQILEVNPLPKYNLTAKACLGILRRAERRGKDLPERLKQVLLMQSASGGGCDGGGKGALVQTEKSGTLGTGNDQTIFCLQGNGIVIRECGEQVPALQARMGTGGNQVPLTYQDVTGTLSPGAHAGSYNGQDAYNDMLVCGATPDVAHTLRAKANCAYREDAETYPVQNMVVRRLTPMECERLQGFPDHWTDIGEWIDEKGKKHKDADSPRYKALGNSIALPFWDWMLRRMARYLPEGATLGSLFDGIGGFPLIFERIHGEGTARWAREIEQFPIAVTKVRFPEEREDGI